MPSSSAQRPALDLLQIDKSLLPRMYESPEVTGTLHAEGAKALGLRAGTPAVRRSHRASLPTP